MVAVSICMDAKRMRLARDTLFILTILLQPIMPKMGSSNREFDYCVDGIDIACRPGGIDIRKRRASNIILTTSNNRRIFFVLPKVVATMKAETMMWT